MMNQRVRAWLFYWSIWGFLGVYMATMDEVMYPKMHFFTTIIPMNLAQNFAWGCAGLGVLWMARRWPIERFAWDEIKNWTIHLFGSVIIALIGLYMIWMIAIAFQDPSEMSKNVNDPEHGYFHFFKAYFHVNLLLMWAVLGAFHGLRIFERYRKREVEAAKLESQLATAQTQALQMQLQPHFLFNTLNSIAALIHSDSNAADRMVSRLADLLRMTLDSGTRQQISLRQEMAFTDAYLGIEGIRFQDRLTVTKDVPAECLDAAVPAFLLQPLVENAIKHGVADMATPSTIEIRARHEPPWLTLEVLDNGRGVNGNRKSGIGTQNTAARLQLMYKDRHTFSLLSTPGNGTRALVQIPWSVEPTAK
ncbi:MAG TPA: histidine kinase [Burkholderiaceae bacterium]|jgi:two-component system LytT family sensor kinase|nr:histidine kinase [Burkholderiaceae bacterium]